MSGDRELWRELADGQEAALAELFARHARAVYNFSFRRLASWAAAEDAVQATFTAVWRRARSGTVDPLRADTALPVLLVMAGYECANLARGARRQRRLRERIGAPPDGPDPADDAAERVDDERAMRAVRAELARLPRGQREVVELVAWSGCSVREAAEALGVAEGTVKSRLSRARATLAGAVALEPPDAGSRAQDPGSPAPTRSPEREEDR